MKSLDEIDSEFSSFMESSQTPRFKVPLKFKTLQNKEFNIDTLSGDNTIALLKLQIEAQEGMLKEKQQLVFRG